MDSKSSYSNLEALKEKILHFISAFRQGLYSVYMVIIIYFVLQKEHKVKVTSFA